VDDLPLKRTKAGQQIVAKRHTFSNEYDSMAKSFECRTQDVLIVIIYDGRHPKAHVPYVNLPYKVVE
jgi:hypothetical protein